MDLLHNQTFLAALMLLLSGGVLALARKVPARLLEYFVRAFTLKVEVTERKSELFDWLTLWLDRQEYSKRARLLSATIAYQQAGEPRISLSPGTGWHLFRYKGKWLFLRRVRTEQKGASAILEREEITIQCLGRDQSAVRDLLGEALKVGRHRDGQITVYTSTDSYWRATTQVVRRPSESVILPRGQMERMIAEIQTFLTNPEYYQARCIPYHLGLLFKGLAGTGKTSSILALASHFDRDIYALNLSNKKLTDVGLIELLSAVPATAFVLLEQIDVMMAAKHKQGISMNTLLDSLDGVFAKEGRVLFMTTNHVDKLDPILIRRGRIDGVYEFTYATTDQIIELFSRFSPRDHHAALCFAERYRDLQVTMSDVQGDLLQGAGLIEVPNKFIGEAAD